MKFEDAELAGFDNLPTAGDIWALLYEVADTLAKLHEIDALPDPQGIKTHSR